MIRIGIVVFEGFEELDAIGPWDVLRSAEAAGAPFDVALVSLDEEPTVGAAKGLRVAVERATGAFDWLIVPGGGWATRPPRGVWAEVQRGRLPEQLRRWRAQGAAVASVCTGAMILSAAGLLRGRPATTHAVAREALRAEGAQVIDARVVDDGDLVTAAGVTSGIDLALWLTERLASPEIARAVATNMEHRPQGTVHRAATRATAPTPPVTVRAASAADLDALAPLFDAYRQFYGRPSELPRCRQFLADRLERRQSTVFLALDGGRAVGFTQLYPSFSSVSAAPIWILNDLYVAPEARGRGVGHALMAAAQGLAAETAAARLTLSTGRTNTTAQRLYEREGYRRDEDFVVYERAVTVTS